MLLQAMVKKMEKTEGKVVIEGVGAKEGVSRDNKKHEHNRWTQ